MAQATLLKDDQRQKPREEPVTALARELLALIETHYERTGDVALKEIVERGKRTLASARR
jgi:hypothetical protein